MCDDYCEGAESYKGEPFEMFDTADSDVIKPAELQKANTVSVSCETAENESCPSITLPLTLNGVKDEPMSCDDYIETAEYCKFEMSDVGLPGSDAICEEEGQTRRSGCYVSRPRPISAVHKVGEALPAGFDDGLETKPKKHDDDLASSVVDRFISDQTLVHVGHSGKCKTESDVADSQHWNPESVSFHHIKLKSEPTDDYPDVTSSRLDTNAHTPEGLADEPKPGPVCLVPEACEGQPSVCKLKIDLEDSLQVSPQMHTKTKKEGDTKEIITYMTYVNEPPPVEANHDMPELASAKTQDTVTDVSPSDSPSVSKSGTQHVGIIHVKCDQCGEEYTRKCAFTMFTGTSHMQIPLNSGERLLKFKFACDLCAHTFSHWSSLMRHKMHYHKCDHCDKQFSKKVDLTVHIRVHSGERSVASDQCGAVSNTGVPKCDVCNKEFARKSYLTKHMQIHSGERPFACDQCPKTFTYNSNLIQHRQIHSGERPFACDHCSKTFRTSNRLTVHMRIHSGERPFTCDQCLNAFRTRSNLTKHMRIHLGERPFACDQCPKTFRTSSGLVEHMRIHSSERPFACDLCPKTFRQRSGLSRHRKKCSFGTETFSM